MSARCSTARRTARRRPPTPRGALRPAARLDRAARVRTSARAAPSASVPSGEPSSSAWARPVTRAANPLSDSARDAGSAATTDTTASSSSRARSGEPPANRFTTPVAWTRSIHSANSGRPAPAVSIRRKRRRPPARVVGGGVGADRHRAGQCDHGVGEPARVDAGAAQQRVELAEADAQAAGRARRPPEQPRDRVALRDRGSAPGDRAIHGLTQLEAPPDAIEHPRRARDRRAAGSVAGDRRVPQRWPAG